MSYPRGRYTFKDAGFLAQLARIGLIACVAMSFVAFVSSWMHRSLLTEARDSEDPPLSKIDLSEAREGVVALVLLGLLVVTAVLVLRWIYRANANTRALFARPMEFTPGWAVGWNFIPIASLWKPYQAMKEIWMASAEAHPTRYSPPWYLLAWWLAWVGFLIVDRVSGRLLLGADDLEELITAANVDLVGHVFFVPAGIMLALLIVRIQSMHTQKEAELRAAGTIPTEEERPWR